MPHASKGDKVQLTLFFILVATVAMGAGLSDSIYANYYKDVYQVTAVQRGFIEFPRELPGLLCVVAVAALSSLGDLRIALIAQILTCAGLIVLGLVTPSFGVMLVFLFMNSFGVHLFMPVQEAIGMSLAEPDRVGQRMGQYASVRSAVGCAAALLVFFGFRLGWFTFATEVKWVFLLGALFYMFAVLLSSVLVKRSGKPVAARRKLRFVFRREYKYYYLLTILHGVQKQIAFVYGGWVIVDLLLKGADTMALLMIGSSFICIFFMNLLGKWMDKFGVKTMLYVDALSFIGIYVLYGVAVWAISTGRLPADGWPVFVIYALYILDRLSMQVGVIKTIYLRSIAFSDADITATLSMGTSLDHIVSIIAALIGGVIWAQWGSQWVFFMAAAFSLGNLFVAWRVHPERERAAALAAREKAARIG